MWDRGSPGATIRSKARPKAASRASAATRCTRVPIRCRAAESISRDTSMPTAGATRDSSVVIRPSPAPISRIRRGEASRARARQKPRWARDSDSFS